MICDLENFALQFGFLIPIFGVWEKVYDWNLIRATLASYWKRNWDLNRPRTLKSVFNFWTIFQVCVLFLSAACSLILLGLWSWVCIEHVRSKILHKILWIHCFQYLISWNLFQIFSMCILCSISSNHTKTCLFKICTKY